MYEKHLIITTNLNEPGNQDMVLTKCAQHQVKEYEKGKTETMNLSCFVQYGFEVVLVLAQNNMAPASKQTNALAVP